MYKPLTIAAFFINLAKLDKISITPKKLQRLVYFAAGFYSAIKPEEESLLNEKIEAWDFGPVIPSLWETFKGVGDKEIPVDMITAKSENISEDDKNFLEVVWQVLKSVDDKTLSLMAHLNDSPWNDLLQSEPGGLKRRQDIKDEDIRRYFTKELEEA